MYAAYIQYTIYSAFYTLKFATGVCMCGLWLCVCVCVCVCMCVCVWVCVTLICVQFYLSAIEVIKHPMLKEEVSAHLLSCTQLEQDMCVFIAVFIPLLFP